MPHEPSGSFPTSFEAHARVTDTAARVTDAPAAGGRERVLRAALLCWAGAVYVLYWLGYLGAR
jgi:hypothetical protein